MTETPEPLSCGHPPTPDSSPGTGVATTNDGRTLCYACSDESEREAIKNADTFTGYISSSAVPGRFTTWPGGELGKVTSYTLGRRIYTRHGSYRMRYVTVRTPDGAEWHGRSSDQMDLITIRRRRA